MQKTQQKIYIIFIIIFALIKIIIDIKTIKNIINKRIIDSNFIFFKNVLIHVFSFFKTQILLYKHNKIIIKFNNFDVI